MRTSLIFSLLLGTAAGSLRAQDAAPTGQDHEAVPDSVTTHFAWPIGTTATVTSRQRKARSSEGKTSDATFRGRYTMTVEKNPEGYRIRHSVFEPLGVESDADVPADSRLYDLTAKLGGLNPDYLVSSEGELIAVDGVEDVSRRIRDALQPMLDSIPGEMAGMQTLMDQLLSEEYLFAKLSEQWELIVFAWSDQEFEIGEEFGFEAEAPSPLVPNVNIMFEFWMSAKSRVPCAEGAEPDSCILFEFTSYPDPEAVAKLTESTVNQALAGPNTPKLTVEEIDVENIVQVIADPETMLPYRFEKSSTTVLTMATGGESGEAYQIDELILEFEYTNAP